MSHRGTETAFSHRCLRSAHDCKEYPDKEMKLLIAVLLGVTAVLARDCPQQGQTLVYLTDKCSKVDDESGDSYPLETIEECRTQGKCCFHNGECVMCYCKSNTQGSGSTTKGLKSAWYSGVEPTKQKAATAGARNLQIFSPLTPKRCLPPPVFPSTCKPQRNEPFVLSPPHNIPYCVRIPCNRHRASVLEKSHRMCGSQPGCYFDKELFEFREAFGPSVLPGVPVCHLAIRNKVFQNKAVEVVKKFGSWNPYFTNCLLNEFDSEIRKGPLGCELIPVVEKFGVVPKMAGWKNINPYHCALIDACFLRGRGCFYPVDINNVRVKSGVRGLHEVRKEVTYGRPRCQNFDTSSPIAILKSYHNCLSAGCSVDYSITRQYYCLLFSLGERLKVKNHWDYWRDVGKGLVGSYNIDKVLGEYGYTGFGPIPTRPPTTTTTFNPFVGGIFGSGSSGGQGGFSVPGGNGGSSSPGFSQGCGEAYILQDGRPCKPKPPIQIKKNSYCPYKPFFVPRFRPLTGSFEGCCDINLCYLPKKEISNMHSGTSHYYTEWTTFSECSVTCGRGEKVRYRKCISRDRKLCDSKLEVDKQPCFATVRQCGVWTNWEQWSPCPKTSYPGGIQTRKRRCSAKGTCPPGEPKEEARDCNRYTCWGGHVRHEGTWTEWSKEQCTYDSLTNTCRTARYRTCLYLGTPSGNCCGSSEESSKYDCLKC